ncbi:MAG TPA: hypothetical protein VFG04_14010 [Planctomycetaceae bacterium]|jgi:orotate phosphoribosyltransferase|nr:hypothetical protein [Planctomycetaceae bacterium]
MIPQHDRHLRSFPSLADLSDSYWVNRDPPSPECMGIDALARAVRDSQPSLFKDEHIATCIRCTSVLTSFRAVSVIDELSPVSFVSLRLSSCATASDSLQILGYISLESMQFELAPDEQSWIPHPMFMRVNLVMDSVVDMFGLSVLDVPEEISAITVTVPRGQVPLSRGVPPDVFELFEPISICGADHKPVDPAELLFSYLRDSEIILRIEVASAQTNREFSPRAIESLLKSIGAIEQEFAYVLPTGLLTDTHVNAATLCDFEAAIQRIASAIDFTFPIHFDVVASNGWPTATIARRLAAIRNRRNAGVVVREIMFEGYVDPMPVEDMPHGARVLVLTDVSVTGGLLSLLCKSVVRFGGIVVGKCAIVAASNPRMVHDRDLRALCFLPMLLSETDEIPELQWREKRYFNPLSSCMTEKKHAGRSPSEFYESDQEARAFWDFLEKLLCETADPGRFYRRHKVVGNTHYSEFIDTLQLLRHETAGRWLVEQIRDRLAERNVVPDVIVCTNRHRAQLFAEMLCTSFDAAVDAAISVVVASKGKFGWGIRDSEAAGKLRGRRVLICDTAIGHGKTVDQLALLASHWGAKGVGVVAILSRLAERAEESFDRRLSNGFHRLFNLPIRPVVIRGASKTICPVCQRQAAIEGAAEETRSEAIQCLAASRSRVPFRREGVMVREPSRAEGPKQLTLFPASTPSFLSTCHASVARGLTLHSLYAARNNGMAPLSLPELSDAAIPPKNRRAMVKDLPHGTLEWSGDALEQTLERCLESESVTSGVWSAAAWVLALEHRSQWVDDLGGFIARSPNVRLRSQPTFWNTLECGSYLLWRSGPSERSQLKDSLSSLASRFEGTEAASRLQGVLETITRLDGARSR